MSSQIRGATIPLVAIGGVGGAAARETIEQALPTHGAGFPAATLCINLFGAFALGALLEALVRRGDDRGARRRIRLLAGTGFLGAFTTYSTFTVESANLVRLGDPASALGYVAATVIGGFVAVAVGIALGARLARTRSVAELPIDSDVEGRR